MAEVWADLKTVRLKLSDPSNIIDLDHVANTAALPATPKRQTAYREDDTGIYKVYDIELSAWTSVDLKISDETLNNLIATNGVNGSVISAIVQIIANLINSMSIVSFDIGTESTQYQTLDSALSFYRYLKTMYTEEADKDTFTSTGRMIRTREPVVGGVRESHRHHHFHEDW